jgi:N-acetylmuramoyl-L-alanine amidase
MRSRGSHSSRRSPQYAPVVPRLLLVVFALALTLVPDAGADSPLVTATADATIGAAPLHVTLSASGEASSYRWELGDGTTATGPAVTHVYAAGAHVATLVAVGADGEETRSSVSILALALSLTAPARADYGARATFRGRLTPPLRRAPVELLRGGRVVTRGETGRAGAFALRTRVLGPGPYEVRYGGIPSPRRSVLVRPALDARVVGTGAVGTPLRLHARVRPAGAGSIRVRIRRGGRVTFDRTFAGSARVSVGTRTAGAFRISVTSVPTAGFAVVRRDLRGTIFRPTLRVGSRGPGVRALEQRLGDLRFALRGTDGLYGRDTYEAVLAFQKVHGLPRTGRVDAALWSRIARAAPPRARYRGDHIEISKGRQVLFVVRGGLVVQTVHVSTGATGNTPLGRWHVYRKVVGWDWILWYPMYFLRGFAIHGYPSVPPYPASHGCVRVPMWIAPQLFAQHAYGSTVYVYT